MDSYSVIWYVTAVYNSVRKYNAMSMEKHDKTAIVFFYIDIFYY